MTQPDDVYEQIIKIGEIFSDHRDEVKDVAIPLITSTSAPELPIAATSLLDNLVPQAVAFNLTVSPQEADCKHPLATIMDHFFTAEEVAVAKRDFELEIGGLPNATLIEHRLLSQYKRGHEQNQRKMKVVYHLKDNLTLADLKAQLEGAKVENNNQIVALQNALLARANQTPIDHPEGSEQAKAYHLLLSRAAEHRHVISISDLFNSFLRQDPSLLTQQNPFLTQTDIDKLYQDLSDYALLNSRTDQIDQSLALVSDKDEFRDIETYEKQLLGAMLDKHRAYDVADFPEFLVYEYATHRILREDQVVLLTKIIELIESESADPKVMHHCLLQFAAGGGKTSVLIPVLAQRFARKGFLPVIFNTNELYQIGLEDIPKNLRASFQQNMEVVERELDHQWSEAEFEKLLLDLTRWKQEGKCILLKPVTWHSINLSWKLANIRGSSGGCLKAKPVLDFFRENAVKLEDECHLVSDPLQQSIKTFGKMQSIPNAQSELLLTCYDCLMGNASNSSEVADLAGIKLKRKRLITAEELTLLQQKLADVIANNPIFKDIQRNDLIAYLLQPDKSRPQWLLDLHKRLILNPDWEEYEKFYDEEFKAQRPDWKMMYDKEAREAAELVVFAKAFLSTHLPHILTLQDQKDYGASIHPGDLTVAPKHEGKDVTSHFGDHTKVAALTIQMYHQRGLLPGQVEQLLDKLMQAHIDERRWNTNTDAPTLTEQWLMRVIPEYYTFSSYLDLTDALKASLSRDPAFCKNQEVINQFLTDFALPQIQVPAERQTSTAAELQGGFRRSVMFSATPGLPEIYPGFLKDENCFMEEAFEAQVIDTMLQLQNRNVCKLEAAQDPAAFFEQFPADLLTKMTTLIDRGALLTDFQVGDVITAYLRLDKRPIASNTAAFFSATHLHLRSKSNLVKEMDVLGAGLIDALKSQGIKPEQFLLFFVRCDHITTLQILSFFLLCEL